MKVAKIVGKDLKIDREYKSPTLLEYGLGCIVEVIGCGLCGSDIIKLKNRLVKENSVLGHEVVGRIVDIDSSCKDCGFRVGDTIILGHHVPCGKCIFCRSGNVSMCKTFKSSNIFPGGFAQYIFVSKSHLENTVFHKPKNLTDIEASFTEPLGCCIRAVKRSDLLENSVVIISGLGTMGILMGQVAKFFGFKVIGCDLLENRCKLAKDVFSFDKVCKLTLDKEKDINKIKSLCNIIRGEDIADKDILADAIFMTSGSYSSIGFSSEAIRNGGKIVVFSSVKDSEGSCYQNNKIYYKELSIIGSYSPSPLDLRQAVDLLAQKKVTVQNLSTVYKIEKINEAIDDTLKNRILKAYIEL